MTKGMYNRPTAEKDAKMSDIWRDKNVPSNVKRKKGNKNKQITTHLPSHIRPLMKLMFSLIYC